MPNVPRFLQSLGLDGDADARAIRRAYARKLKQIDQEADPAGFQQLREAYEAALAWDEWRSRTASAEPQAPVVQAPAQPESEATAQMAAGAGSAVVEEPVEPGMQHQPAPMRATPAPFTEDPLQLARSVFMDLQQWSGQDGGADWCSALERSLADTRLFNVGARIAFEELVAQRLAHGWQSGNEALFQAAIGVFGWAGDRRRLLSLGHAGQVINAALSETVLFDNLPERERKRLRKAISLLQSAAPPAEPELRRNAVDIYKLMTLFPALASVTANPRHADGWRQRYEELPPRKRGEKPPARRNYVFYAFVLIALVRFMAHLMGPSDTPSYQRTQQRRPEPPTLEVSQDRIDEIGSRLRTLYKPGPNTKEGKSYIVCEVFIDADGKVFGVNKLDRAGDPAYHDAVKKAILETKPFPPGTRTIFRLRFEVDLHKKKAAARTPAEASRPAPLPMPQDRIDEITSRIRTLYQPGPDAKEGKSFIVCQVFLDANGKVVRVTQVEAGGDPAYQEAAKKAIMETKPFAPGTSNMQLRFWVDRHRERAPVAAPGEPASSPDKPAATEPSGAAAPHDASV